VASPLYAVSWLLQIQMVVGTTKTGSYSTAFHTCLQMLRRLYPAGGKQLPSSIVPGSLEPVTKGGPLYLFILRHIFTPTTLQLRWGEQVCSIGLAMLTGQSSCPT
jgi:hypothetical protein